MATFSFGAKLPVFLALLFVFSVAIACGGSAPAEPVVVEKEVIKEVEKPVVVEKEVIKEVEKPVVVEKEVVKEVEKEVVREVLVTTFPNPHRHGQGNGSARGRRHDQGRRQDKYAGLLLPAAKLAPSRYQHRQYHELLGYLQRSH